MPFVLQHPFGIEPARGDAVLAVHLEPGRHQIHPFPAIEFPDRFWLDQVFDQLQRVGRHVHAGGVRGGREGRQQQKDEGHSQDHGVTDEGVRFQ